jgi:hypothetical protein
MGDLRYASAMKPAADLVLAKLNDEQVALARQTNGARRRITHALLCGSYGQIFGTEKQCAKYYDAWGDIFDTCSVKSTKPRRIQFSVTKPRLIWSRR